MSISFLDNGLRIRFSGKSDIGRVRDHNEDDILLPSEIPIAAVSDGMGGHACGEVASHLAVETVDNYYARTCAEAPPNWPFRMPQLQIERDRMTSAIKLANTRIHETGLGDPSKKGMGCTLDAIYFSQGRCYIGHVGDSRVYKIRGNQITQVTEDHSLLNDYRRMREMSGDELDNFGYKNVVVRALGLSPACSSTSTSTSTNAATSTCCARTDCPACCPTRTSSRRASASRASTRRPTRW